MRMKGAGKHQLSGTAPQKIKYLGSFPALPVCDVASWPDTAAEGCLAGQSKRTPTLQRLSCTNFLWLISVQSHLDGRPPQGPPWWCPQRCATAFAQRAVHTPWHREWGGKCGLPSCRLEWSAKADCKGFERSPPFQNSFAVMAPRNFESEGQTRLASASGHCRSGGSPG